MKQYSIDIETGRETCVEIPDPVIPQEDILAMSKSRKAEEITAYDLSEAVRSFTLRGTAMWIDRDLRVSLERTIHKVKAAGRDTFDLWHGTSCFTLPVSEAIELLGRVELYALECCNVTHRHLAAVEAMTDAEEVERYDITKGYPPKLSL